MHSPSEVVHNWLCNSHGAEMPGYVATAARQIQRYEDSEAQRFVDWSAEDLQRFAEMIDQQRLEFAEEDRHENVRRALARYLDTTIAPHTVDPAIRKLSTRLREARQTCTYLYRRRDGKHITMWDAKAGLPLLCPDDAREEAMRVQRRITPEILKAVREQKARVYSCVFTDHNSRPGELRKGMRAIQKKFAALMRKCKRDNSLPILGAYVVMEAPLGGYRDWHPHLNVFLVTRGWLDYEKLRRLWARNVEMGHVSGDEDSIAAALREMIKYAVRAVPEKSDAKAKEAESSRRRRYKDRARSGDRPIEVLRSEDGQGADAIGNRSAIHGCDEERPHAPAMTLWTPAEWLEWWTAHKGFRRSRGYGCLYNVDKPEKESIEEFETVGTGTRDGQGRIVRRFSLLEFIPGDKSSTIPLKDRLREHLQRLFGDPDRHKRQLQLMQQAAAAWQTMQKTTH